MEILVCLAAILSLRVVEATPDASPANGNLASCEVRGSGITACCVSRPDCVCRPPNIFPADAGFLGCDAPPAVICERRDVGDGSVCCAKTDGCQCGFTGLGDRVPLCNTPAEAAPAHKAIDEDNPQDCATGLNRYYRLCCEKTTSCECRADGYSSQIRICGEEPPPRCATKWIDSSSYQCCVKSPKCECQPKTQGVACDAATTKKCQITVHASQGRCCQQEHDCVCDGFIDGVATILCPGPAVPSTDAAPQTANRIPIPPSQKTPVPAPY